MSQAALIRPARPDDAGAIAAIWRELGWLAWQRLAGEAELRRRVAAQLELAEEGGEHRVMVAEVEGEAVGYAAVHRVTMMGLPEPEAYLSELFVRKAQRGRGLGGRLLAAAEEEARRWGASRIMLMTGRNRASYQRGFYAARGYRERPQLANFVKPLLEY